MKTTVLSRLYENMTFEISVLNSYIDRVENDVCQGIESYKEKINVVHEEEFEENNQSYYHETTECEGLDSDTYSFESVFEELFPRLQRGSALITLCSFFECSLIRLCDDLQRVYSLEKHLNCKRKGVIESAMSYLKGEVGIELDKGASNYSDIKNIQNVRNCFVHHDGRIIDKVKSFASSNEFLSGEFKININSGFLLYVLSSYKDFFQTIHDALSNNNQVSNRQEVN